MKITQEEYKVLFPRGGGIEPFNTDEEDKKLNRRREAVKTEGERYAQEIREKELSDLGVGGALNLQG